MDQQHIPCFEFLKRDSHSDVLHCQVLLPFHVPLRQRVTACHHIQLYKSDKRFQKKCILGFSHVILCNRRLKCHNSLTIMDKFPNMESLLGLEKRWFGCVFPMQEALADLTGMANKNDLEASQLFLDIPSSACLVCSAQLVLAKVLLLRIRPDMPTPWHWN